VKTKKTSPEMTNREGPGRRGFLKGAAGLLAAGQAGALLPFATQKGEAQTAFLPQAGSVGPEVIVETTTGKIRGITIQGIKTFVGIPYGDTTAGENRFMPPKKPKPWGGVRDALIFGPRVPQRDTTSDIVAVPIDWFNQSGRFGEDCLVLNVWTPGVNDGRKRPVMFWLHGGGFHQGSGMQTYYDGKALCRRGDVVVVTSNHRLASLGYLYLAELGGPDYAQTGNVGMLDIVAALEWVRDNIATFGGDPNNVMVFGCSGGGAKTSTLHAMPSAKGLFHRAIIQSGPGLKARTREEATKSAEQLLTALGIDKTRIRELHKMPIERILDAQSAAEGPRQSMPAAYAPVVDGAVLPRNPFDPDAPEMSADVPLIIGTTKDEAAFFSINELDAVYSLDEQGLRTRVRAMLKDTTDQILSGYHRIYATDTPTDLLFRIVTDQRMWINSIKLAERKAALHRGLVYMYRWAWPTPVWGGRLRSTHGGELSFVFDTTDLAYTMTGGTAEARALAAKMSSTWIAFARSGDPNIKELPRWDPYTTETRATMVFNNNSTVVRDPEKQARELWQQQTK
jgi:para-nitrobenzyl esterase